MSSVGACLQANPSGVLPPFACRQAPTGVHQRGFSLMELIIAVAIVAILAGVAYPSYVAQVAKARRAEAASALLEGAQALERFYSANGTYLRGGNIAAVFRTRVPENGSAYYTIAAVAASANAFTLQATRAGAMAGDGCGDFGLNSAGTRTLQNNDAGYTVADCWRR